MKRNKTKPTDNGHAPGEMTINTVSLGPGVVEWQAKNLDHMRVE